MGYANGRVPTTALRTVTPGNELLSATANAYKSLVLLGNVLGWAIKPASGEGSAYRSFAMQSLYWNAAHGNKVDAQKVGLSTSSTIAVAIPGQSSHGDGKKIDLVFNGSDHPTADQIALANHCGFSRQFNAADPNHFAHDGKTMVSGPGTADWNRIIAKYLNDRHLGHTTTTVHDGKVNWAIEQNFTLELQTAGYKDGLYPSPLYKRDGIGGPKTSTLWTHYRTVLWNSL